MPHDRLLGKTPILKIFEEFVAENIFYFDKFMLRNEPEYMFVVNSSREKVLLD